MSIWLINSLISVVWGGSSVPAWSIPGLSTEPRVDQRCRGGAQRLVMSSENRGPGSRCHPQGGACLLTAFGAADQAHNPPQAARAAVIRAGLGLGASPSSPPQPGQPTTGKVLQSNTFALRPSVRCLFSSKAVPSRPSRSFKKPRLCRRPRCLTARWSFRLCVSHLT